MRAIPREVNDAFVRDAQSAYAFGLWCADGYWWSSSIGISNADPDLVLSFADFLLKISEPRRLRLRIYQVPGDEPDARVTRFVSQISVRPAAKMKRTAYQLYINSRSLVRRFFSDRDRLNEFPTQYLGSYFAGRFDGDGVWGVTPRIAYTTESEARTDVRLLESSGVKETSVLYYRKANEFCIYIRRASLPRFEQLIEPQSLKLKRRFTL